MALPLPALPLTPPRMCAAHMSNLLAVVLLALHTMPVQLHTGVAVSHPITLFDAAKASQLFIARRCASSAATACRDMHAAVTREGACWISPAMSSVVACRDSASGSSPSS